LTPPKIGGLVRFGYPRHVWSGSSITANGRLRSRRWCGRILLDVASYVFQVWELFRNMLVQSLDN
jgi:hypothetical protein